MSINFKEQISAWWDSQLAQLNILKAATQDAAAIKLASTAGDETSLNDEQSAQLLAQLVQLIDVFLEEDFPVFKAKHSDTEAALKVYNWHLMAWDDVLDRVDDLNEKKGNLLASSAKGILKDLVKLPFTLSQNEGDE